jgi:acyl-CoA reductase-like NAD-dependent aldehyde dehydrogenase
MNHVETVEIRNPFNQKLVGKIDETTEAELDEALQSAYDTFHQTMKKMPAHERANILRKTAEILESKADKFVDMLAKEAGKPIKTAKKEVQRALQILNFAADEAKTKEGELISMDSAVGGEQRMGMVKNVPLGVVAAITPFNFPLNLVLHKLAPAFAAGNTVVLKPAEKTTYCSIMLAECFAEAGLPEGALHIVIGPGSEIGDPLVTDSRVSKVTFTGSVKVGKMIREKIGLKKVTLELGSNSPNIVFADADIDQAAKSLVQGSFAFAGQVCISVQRIYVQQSVYEEFLEKAKKYTEKLKLGDPLNENTDVGPMITEDDAERVQEWVQEAEKQGAKVLTGGKRDGALMEPTILINVKHDMKVICEEIFGPVVSIIPFEKEEEAIRMANDSEFGLQAGVFTQDINRAMRLADELETGGVWINETSAYRQDNYPYGGVKQSGLGKEGIKYAVDDMVDKKFIGINLSNKKE